MIAEYNFINLPGRPCTNIQQELPDLGEFIHST
jgi:hypothetical protein